MCCVSADMPFDEQGRSTAEACVQHSKATGRMVLLVLHHFIHTLPPFG
jgi:hypothetical protein